MRETRIYCLLERHVVNMQQHTCKYVFIALNSLLPGLHRSERFIAWSLSL